MASVDSHPASAARAHGILARRDLLLWVLIAIALGIGVFGGLRRGWKNKPDWRDFMFETRYVWDHHQTRPGTAMFGYLPTTTFVLWPFTVALPQPAGVWLWVACNTAAALASVWLVQRYWLKESVAWVDLAVPLAIVVPNLAHGIQSNQTTMLTLLFCVAGLTLVHRRRPLVGGGILGLAAVFKTMPVLLAGYLLLTRRWRALLGLMLGVVLFDAVPSVAFFGVNGTIREHQAWFRRTGWHTNGDLIEQPFLRVDRHTSNASFSAVLTRWLRSPPDATKQVILYGDPPAEVIEGYRAALAPNELLTLDPMPPDEGLWRERRVADLTWVPRFHVLDLPAWAVRLLWAAVLLVAGAALAWHTWQSTRQSTHDWAPLAALWLLAMFWPSPMMRHYYLAWAFPAVVIVWQALSQERRRDPGCWSTSGILAMAALIAWLIGAACLGWFVVRWYGIHLLALAMLTAATAWYSRRSAPGALDVEQDYRA